MPSIYALFEHESIAFDWSDRDLAFLEHLNQMAGAEILHVMIKRR